MTKYIALLLLPLLCYCTSPNNSRVSTLPYYKEATFTPHWLDQDATELQDFHRIPDFQLVNQNGRSITAKDFTGKIYVADFIFTSCAGICPKMMNNMAIVQDAFKDDPAVLLISHSVTPAKDSVPVLREFADAKGLIDGKWHLVTGVQQDIYDLGRQAYFVEEDLGLQKEADEFLHTENFVLIDANRHIRGIYNGINRASIDQLIADIKTLKAE